MTSRGGPLPTASAGFPCSVETSNSALPSRFHKAGNGGRTSP
jgi:hypothetical protein